MSVKSSARAARRHHACWQPRLRLGSSRDSGVASEAIGGEFWSGMASHGSLAHARGTCRAGVEVFDSATGRGRFPTTQPDAGRSAALRGNTSSAQRMNWEDSKACTPLKRDTIRSKGLVRLVEQSHLSQGEERMTSMPQSNVSPSCGVSVRVSVPSVIWMSETVAVLASIV